MNVLTIGGVKIEGLAACVPAHAVENEAQVRLGLPKDVVAFDVSLACSGWGYGLYLAGLQLEEGGTIQMDGFGVFKFVATDVVGYLREFLSANSQQLTANSFVPHQPNVYMVRQLAKSLGVAEGTTAISCDQLGNLSSASVPVTIAWKNVRGPVFFSGFGGGLSVSIGMIEIDEDCKLAVMEV